MVTAPQNCCWTNNVPYCVHQYRYYSAEIFSSPQKLTGLGDQRFDFRQGQETFLRNVRTCCGAHAPSCSVLASHLYMDWHARTKTVARNATACLFYTPELTASCCFRSGASGKLFLRRKCANIAIVISFRAKSFDHPTSFLRFSLLPRMSGLIPVLPHTPSWRAQRFHPFLPLPPKLICCQTSVVNKVPKVEYHYDRSEM